jgi:hypothetical protein
VVGVDMRKCLSCSARSTCLRPDRHYQKGTLQVKDIAAAPRVKVSADGHGVVSHAGMGLLRELANLTGLSAQVTAALADTYKGPWVYAPGAVFADLAAAVADGADCIDGVGRLCGDREHVFGAVGTHGRQGP